MEHPEPAPAHEHDWRIFRWGSTVGLALDNGPHVIERDCLGCDRRQRATHDGKDVVWVNFPKPEEARPEEPKPTKEPSR